MYYIKRGNLYDLGWFLGTDFQVGVKRGQLIFIRYPPSSDRIKCLPVQLNKKN